MKNFFFVAIFFSFFKIFSQNSAEKDFSQTKNESIVLKNPNDAIFLTEENLQNENIPQILDESQSAQNTFFTEDDKNFQNEKDAIQNDFKIFCSSLKKIRMMEKDNDIFSASFSKNHALTNIAQNELVRRFYDKNFRQSKIEYWQIAPSSAQSKLSRTLTYAYFSNGKIRSIKEQDFFLNTSSIAFFYENGKMRSQRKNKFLEGALFSFEIFIFEYDEDWRIVREEKRVYKMKGKNENLVLTQTTLNKYKGENLLEVLFYENSLLRIRTIYSDSSKKNFIRSTYFDNGIFAREFFRNGEKVFDSFSGNSKKRGGQN